MMTEIEEVRFKFGKNWSSFLKMLDESRIQEAEASLKKALGRSDLQGLRFLDVGRGVGYLALPQGVWVQKYILLTMTPNLWLVRSH